VNPEPLVYRIDDARRALGLGTTKVYELIGAGVLDARKSGSRTLITGESLRAYLASLPKADIRTGQRGAE
jgi:excisionase family DNA binding protein